MESRAPSWQTTVVAVAFIALVAVMFVKAVDSGNFGTIWAGVGSLVGVLTGAIPSYFFRVQAQNERAKTESLLGVTSPETWKAAQKAYPLAWGAGANSPPD